MFIILNSLLTRLLIYVLLSSFSEFVFLFGLENIFSVPQFQLPLPVYIIVILYKRCPMELRSTILRLPGSGSRGVLPVGLLVFLLWGWHSGGQDWPLETIAAIWQCWEDLSLDIFVRFGIDELCYWQVMSTNCQQIGSFKLVPASILSPESPTDSYLSSRHFRISKQIPFACGLCTFQPSVFTHTEVSGQMSLSLWPLKVDFSISPSSIVFLDIFPLVFKAVVFGHSLLLCSY